MSDPVFLYVEDDPMSRKVMHTLITRVLKFPQLTIWEDSANFVERIQLLDPVPNIIFLDVQIHPLDGYEMLRMLRNEARFRDSIIIAMTANVMSHDVEKLQQTGFSG